MIAFFSYGIFSVIFAALIGRIAPLCFLFDRQNCLDNLL